MRVKENFSKYLTVYFIWQIIVSYKVSQKKISVVLRSYLEEILLELVFIGYL